MNFDLAQAGDGMEAAQLGRDQVHVLDEYRHHRHPRFLGNEINPRLTWRDLEAVTPCAFGKHDQIKLFACPAKGLQLLDAPGIELAAFEQKPDAAAQHLLEPRGVPD